MDHYMKHGPDAPPTVAIGRAHGADARRRTAKHGSFDERHLWREDSVLRRKIYNVNEQ